MTTLPLTEVPISLNDSQIVTVEATEERELENMASEVKQEQPRSPTDLDAEEAEEAFYEEFQAKLGSLTDNQRKLENIVNKLEQEHQELKNILEETKKKFELAAGNSTGENANPIDQIQQLKQKIEEKAVSVTKIKENIESELGKIENLRNKMESA